jgi:hypothetical protein
MSIKDQILYFLVIRRTGASLVVCVDILVLATTSP